MVLNIHKNHKAYYSGAVTVTVWTTIYTRISITSWKFNSAEYSPSHFQLQSQLNTCFTPNKVIKFCFFINRIHQDVCPSILSNQHKKTCCNSSASVCVQQHVMVFLCCLFSHFILDSSLIHNFCDSQWWHWIRIPLNNGWNEPSGFMSNTLYSQMKKLCNNAVQHH